MSELSITRAPSVNVSATATSVTPSSAISVGINTPQFLVPNSAPNLSLRAISSPQINITSGITSPSSLNLSGVGARLGVSTSGGGISSNLSFSSLTLPSTGQALNTVAQGLGVNLPGAVNLNSLSQAFTSGVSSLIPAGSLSLSGLQFPKFPPFPGIGKIGLLLGAGKEAIAKILALDAFIPPHVPGLKINMGMALAAIKLVQVALSTNPSELVKHLLDGIISDLTDQVADQLESALDASGINDIQNQIGDIQNQVSGMVGIAENSFVENFNRLNPPQTITNEDGETIQLPRPQPDVSQFRNVSVLPPQGTSILQAVSNTTTSAGSSILSQAKAFTFPPKG